MIDLLLNEVAITLHRLSHLGPIGMLHIPKRTNRLGVGLQAVTPGGSRRILGEELTKLLISFPALQQPLDVSDLGQILGSGRRSLAIDG